jgi:hypothetical protein
MITRRLVVFAGALALVGAFPETGQADPAAKAFLEKIYAAYKGKNSKGVMIDSDAALRRYFEPGLAALINKDERAAARRHDVPSLEGDPFVNSQDWEIKAVEIMVEDTAPDKATATVTFMNIDMPEKLVYDLVKLKTGWRIADIDWGENGTLRGLYVKK